MSGSARPVGPGEAGSGEGAPPVGPGGDTGVSALLLAGGRSSRLGLDKPFVEVGGRTLLERALAATGEIRDIVLSVRDPAPFVAALESRGWRPAGPGPGTPEETRPGTVVEAAALIRGPRRVRILPDAEPDAGPMAALAGGLEAVRGHLVVVLSVDLPFVTRALVAHLLSTLARSPDTDACVPVIGRRPQWLCAAYRARLAPAAGERVKRAGDPSVSGFVEGCAWLGLDESDLAVCGDPSVLTRDIDTREDLAWARARAEEAEEEAGEVGVD